MGCAQSSSGVSGVYIIPITDSISDLTRPKHVDEFQKTHPEAIQILCTNYRPESKHHIVDMFKNATPGIYRYDTTKWYDK